MLYLKAEAHKSKPITHYTQPESKCFKRSTALTAAAKKKKRAVGNGGGKEASARQPGPATVERKNERGGEQELREKNEKEKVKILGN